MSNKNAQVSKKSWPIRFCEWIFSLPFMLWEELKKRLVSWIVTFLIYIPVAVGSFIWGMYFAQNPNTRLQQDSYGAHCPATLFESARDSGLTITFEPKELENALICGRPIISRDNDIETTKEMLKSFSQCYDTEEITDAELKVGPSQNDDLINISTNGELPLYACRCDKKLLPILVEAKQDKLWCAGDRETPTPNKIAEQYRPKMD